MSGETIKKTRFTVSARPVEQAFVYSCGTRKPEVPPPLHTVRGDHLVNIYHHEQTEQIGILTKQYMTFPPFV